MEVLQFRAKVKKCRYDSESFKIYLVDVNETEYKNIKPNSNGQFIVVGDIPSLIPNIEYNFSAIKKYAPKFGLQYEVKSVSRELKSDVDSTKSFLLEIITEKQANELIREYPNIIEKVMNNDLRDINTSKLKGIGIATFNGIKDKIVENYCLIDLVNKYGGTISMNMIKKMYDKYGNVKTIQKKLQESPYKALCGISRVGFKTADDILQKLESDKKIVFSEPLKQSKQRMIACFEYVLQQNELNGNTNMDIKTLRVECDKLTPECIHLFVDCIKEKSDKVYIDMDNKLVGLRNTRGKELYIYDKITKMVGVSNIWRCAVENYRSVNGSDLTDEQVNTITMMCENSIGILTAAGGSGKSFSVQALINMCDDYNISYKLMTPTGASSKVLGEYVGKECTTIHRGLEFNPRAKDDEPKWGYNAENPLEEQLVIIDEFSMCDISLFFNVMQAVDIEKTKLLLVFDPYQLSSVGCGNLAQDFIMHGNMPINRLTKIFRYAEGGLMNIATSIRNSEAFLKPPLTTFNKAFGKEKDFIYYEKRDAQVLDCIKYVYQNLRKVDYSIQDIMVLSSQNKGDYGTVAINKIIQNIIQGEKPKDEKNYFVQRGDTKFFLGDKVIQIQNNYKAKIALGTNKEGEIETSIFNGNTGVVSKVGYDYIHVDFDDETIKYERDDLNQLELGYCISIHKSQGSASKQVVVVAPRQHTFMLNSNLLYVGVTRSKQRCFMIGDISTINRSIKKKENLTRRTWAEVYWK